MKPDFEDFKIGEYFWYSEMVRSETAERHRIDNTPPPEAMSNACYTAQVADCIREDLGLPMVVTSWFRAPKVNKKAGGSSTSDHMNGHTFDFCVPGKKLQEVFDFIRDNYHYDQIGINKRRNYIHYSIKREGNREQVITY